MLIQVVLFVSTGALMVGLAVPLMRRKVGPNRFYGLRVPATYADESVWYEANARTGRDLLLYGVSLIGLALLLPPLGFDADAYALTMAGAAVAGAITMLVLGWSRANRLLRERKNRDERSRVVESKGER